MLHLCYSGCHITSSAPSILKLKLKMKCMGIQCLYQAPICNLKKGLLPYSSIILILVYIKKILYRILGQCFEGHPDRLFILQQAIIEEEKHFLLMMHPHG